MKIHTFGVRMNKLIFFDRAIKIFKVTSYIIFEINYIYVLTMRLVKKQHLHISSVYPLLSHSQKNKPSAANRD